MSDFEKSANKRMDKQFEGSLTPIMAARTGQPELFRRIRSGENLVSP